jgi:N6-adenosine-specific RNA methylase IME4
VLVPIWTTKDNTIIAGHRRVNACRELGIKEIESHVKPFSKVLVIESNRYREKTWAEKLEEAKALEELFKPIAKEKQVKGGEEKVPQIFAKPLESRKEIAEKIGTSHETLRKAKIIAQERPELLKEIDKGKESIHYAYRKIERDKNKESKFKKMENQKLPKDKFQVILADPPWRYEHSFSKSREIENQYPTISLSEICELPIPQITTDDSILFLWTTSPKLEESMEVIKAWHYTYRTCGVWVKDKIGMGYYLRQQHELFLIAKRGNFPSPVLGSQSSSVFHSPRTKHSEKPEIIYEIIEKLYPNLKYLELFARNKRKGWSSWGNEL